MSASLLWANLAAYSVQVLALVAVGGLLPLLLRIHQPRAQLLYLRLLLAGALLLPALQPWRRPVVMTVTLSSAAATAPAAPPSAPLPARPQIRWEEVGLVVLGAGVALRLLWLLLGMWRLRRLRIGSEPLEPVPEAVEAARLRTGVEAAVSVSDEVGGPVTFGARRPVVLLPPALLEQPYAAQFGIACHEFLHVRRRDWLYTVVEEFAGALVWFHPAVWWLLGQIRLAREQVVDREVVSITEAQEPYVHALLSMGGGRPQLDLAPATLFLRKRHLANRVHSLLKEVTMSKGRLVSSYVLTAAVALAAAWFATTSFPLEASPRVEVQQSTPSQGVVRVELAPNLSEPLRSKLRDRLASFQGRPYTLEIRAEILKAAREVDPAAGIPMMIQSEAPDGSIVSRFVVGVGPIPSATQGPVRVDVSGLPEPLRSTMEARLAPFEGRMYTPDLQEEITNAARAVDERASIGIRAERASEAGPATVTVFVVARPGTQAMSPLPPATGRRIQVGGAEQQKKLVSQARPQYPPLARQARIQGTVRFTALIGVDGRVANITLVSGHPLLVPPAQEAVQQWTYEPTLLNGEPVEVVTQIDVNFTLL